MFYYFSADSGNEIKKKHVISEHKSIWKPT